MEFEKINGLIAAPPTGFRADGSVDLSVVRALAEHLNKQGVRGVFINGTTGEGASLSSEERMELAEQWKKVLVPEMMLFVHVGHLSAQESRTLAVHAEHIGADAIAAIAPGFYKPGNREDLINWCDSIASAAVNLPFYFYHMPSMNGVHLNIAKLLAEVKARIPSFAGVKYTFETMGDYFESVQSSPELNILWGRDEMLLGALAMGARGAVGSIYNIATPLFLKIIESFENGDIEKARNLQFQIIQLINIIVKNDNFFSYLKRVLAMQGVPISSITRSPLRTLTEEENLSLGNDLRDWKRQYNYELF